ncbi:hypothetical protein IFU19_13460 [Microbacterium sp. CFBP 8794]|nr:hypothetical protein [Microbacterium sp. CFBP 8794]
MQQEVVAVSGDADRQRDRAVVAHEGDGGGQGAVDHVVERGAVGDLVVRKAAHPRARGEGKIGHGPSTFARVVHRIVRFSRFRLDQ